jgi:hypothetical protein
MVRDLLGHRSEQTTRQVYLAPLNGLQVRSMLDHDEDLETLLSRVAASSRLVIDTGQYDRARRWTINTCEEDQERRRTDPLSTAKLRWLWLNCREVIRPACPVAS